MNTYEQLIAEWLTIRGYIVVVNEKVGRRYLDPNVSSGGWSGELDVVGWNPKTDDLVHYEPSLDAYSWAKREARYSRKFELGRKHLRDLPQFSHLTEKQVKGMRQIAVFVNIKAGSEEGAPWAGGTAVSMDHLVGEILGCVASWGLGYHSAIPEKYPLLRTLQFGVNGMRRRPVVSSEETV